MDLAREKPLTFNDPTEVDVWHAAYAAAYVQLFFRLMDNGNASYDRSRELRSSHAESAETIADDAVRGLREWRKNK